MAILGISSASKVTSVGLADNSKLLAELTISCKASFTEDLVAYIDKIVNEANVGLSAVAVASGPGSYNGLRGSLSVAKTIAQVKSIPIIEVSTLEAVAYNLIDIEGTIFVATDARKDEYNAALFSVSNRTLRRLTKDMVLRAEKIKAFLSKIEGKLYVCDSTSELADLISSKGLKTELKLVSFNHSSPKGINVALLGEVLLNQGITSDPLKLAPKYSVDPKLREYKRN